MFETTGELNNYLAPNERVLWQGQGQRRLNSAALGGYLFSAMFVGFALIFGLLFLLTAGSSRGRGNDDEAVAAVIVPVIFLIVGLSVGVPLIMIGRRTGNARYCVTTSSAVILYPPAAWSGRRVTIVPLKNLQQLTLSENRDGTGSLTFAQSLYTGYGRYSSSWLASSVPAFMNIERPMEVYQLIRKQMDEAVAR